MPHCSICAQNDENLYTLECNHTFHPECIISWFRMGKTTCPMCRDTGATLILRPHGSPGSISRFEHLRKLSKYSNAPPLLKDAILGVTEKEKILETYTDKLTEFVRTASGKYTCLYAKIKHKKKKIAKLQFEIKKVKQCISFQNYDRIIIPIKKVVY